MLDTYPQYLGEPTRTIPTALNLTSLRSLGKKTWFCTVRFEWALGEDTLIVISQYTQVSTSLDWNYPGGARVVYKGSKGKVINFSQSLSADPITGHYDALPLRFSDANFQLETNPLLLGRRLPQLSKRKGVVTYDY